jgi:lathosterol oxidase
MTNVGWLQHKYQHVFFNPTPFSVIADEYIDQFVRAMPLVLFPLMLPINVDMMYVTFGVFFYGYGVALHCGHELDLISAHNYWINTPFQHYVHHAKSVYKKPYHTGFFIKVWDRMFGSLYEEKCVCAECARKEGKRGVEKWNKVKKIDYSPLLSWKFWKNPDTFEQVQQMEADVAGDEKE